MYYYPSKAHAISRSFESQSPKISAMNPSCAMHKILKKPSQKIGRMNGPLRNGRKCSESKSRTFPNDAHPSTSLPHNDVPKMEILVTTTTTVQIETLPFDWTLFSGTTAIPTSIPSELSFDSGGFDRPDAVQIPLNWSMGSQNTALCGIGQWTDSQGSSSRSRQSLSNPIDDAEDPKLDLTELHALASRTPFEQYLQLRKVEAGTSSLQPYSALLCTF